MNFLGNVSWNAENYLKEFPVLLNGISHNIVEFSWILVGIWHLNSSHGFEIFEKEWGLGGVKGNKVGGQIRSQGFLPRTGRVAPRQAPSFTAPTSSPTQEAQQAPPISQSQIPIQ